MTTKNLYQSALKVLAEFAIKEPQVQQLTLRMAEAVTGPGARANQPLLLCNDPAHSVVEPRFIVVGDIDELKRIGGVHDARYDEGHAQVCALPQAPTAAVLATEQPYHPDICLAFQSYLFGDSRKVATYRDAINRLRFPLKVAVFVADDLIVTRDRPLIIRDEEGHGDPIAVICNSVTVYDGGRISWEASGKMTCNKLIFKSAPYARAGAPGVAEPTGSSFISRGSAGSDGAHGTAGAPGSAGINGNAAADNKNKCDRSATNGTNGTVGGDGGDGSPGGAGGNALPIIVQCGELNGVIQVGSCGGNGGKGGDGGQGGDGGTGGNGGNGSTHCSTGAGGHGGNGGVAGRGGRGGDGGDGALVSITYLSGSPEFQKLPDGGEAGDGGNQGVPGAGGAGGTGAPAGHRGERGKVPEAPQKARCGNPGQVVINRRSL